MTDSYHDVVLRPGDGGQHVDTVGREVSSLLGLVVDAVCPAGVHHMFSVMFIQDDQIPLTETQKGGVNASCRTEVTARVTARFRTAEPSLRLTLKLTRVWTVQQSNHVFGLLPQTVQEGDHQVPDVLRVVGGEGVLVSFDGGQCETLTLQFSPSGQLKFKL